MFNYPKVKSYTVIYQLNHRNMGFQNSITIRAVNYDLALEDARKQVSETYGSDMLKKFSFKPDPLNNGTAI